MIVQVRLDLRHFDLRPYDFTWLKVRRLKGRISTKISPFPFVLQSVNLD